MGWSAWLVLWRLLVCGEAGLRLRPHRRWPLLIERLLS